jgi:hypothetical protein
MYDVEPPTDDLLNNSHFPPSCLIVVLVTIPVHGKSRNYTTPGVMMMMMMMMMMPTLTTS